MILYCDHWLSLLRHDVASSHTSTSSALLLPFRVSWTSTNTFTIQPLNVDYYSLIPLYRKWHLSTPTWEAQCFSFSTLRNVCILISPCFLTALLSHARDAAAPASPSTSSAVVYVPDNANFQRQTQRISAAALLSVLVCIVASAVHLTPQRPCPSSQECSRQWTLHTFHATSFLSCNDKLTAMFPCPCCSFLPDFVSRLTSGVLPGPTDTNISITDSVGKINGR